MLAKANKDPRERKKLSNDSKFHAVPILKRKPSPISENNLISPMAELQRTAGQQ